MVSLCGKLHGNASPEGPYRSHEIVKISKLSSVDLSVKVKSKEALLRLERTTVNTLGGFYTLKEFDVLGGKYFIDISNMDSTSQIWTRTRTPN